MFGKGGGPLNAWIKEFCELVFIQTLQAFIFALVISFVLNIMQKQTGLDQTDRNTSLGIICIVALTSIFKIEEIARRIFGYGPTKADHANAVQSIGKSMAALHLGKNLLDNGKKFAGGAGAIIGARADKKKYLRKTMERKNAWKLDNGIVDEKDTKPFLPVGVTKNNTTVAENKDSVSTQQRKIDSAKRDKIITLQQDAAEARSRATKEKDESKKKALIAEARSKLVESRSIDDTLVEVKAPKAATNSGSTGGGDNKASSSDSSKSGGKPKDYYQTQLKMRDEYDEKMKEFKKKKRQGIKQMVSGFAESGAAMVGFVGRYCYECSKYK